MNDAACEPVSHPSLGLCKHRQKALAGETVQEVVGQVKRSLRGGRDCPEILQGFEVGIRVRCLCAES